MKFKMLIFLSTMAFGATSAMAQTSGAYSATGSTSTGYTSSNSSPGGSASSGASGSSGNDHFYSHYKPYFPLMGSGIPSQSTYKPYFPPAYSTPSTGPKNMGFGARIVDTNAHIDLLHKNFTGATVDAQTGAARFSHGTVPGSYQGNVWYGYFGGCRAKWFWDASYHKYVKQAGCI